MKDICEKPVANIIHHGKKKKKAFPLIPGTRKGIQAFYFHLLLYKIFLPVQ